MAQPLTEEEKEAILNLLKKEKDAAKVAKLVGRSHYSVYQLSQKNNIELKGKQPLWIANP